MNVGSKQSKAICVCWAPEALELVDEIARSEGRNRNDYIKYVVIRDAEKKKRALDRAKDSR